MSRMKGYKENLKRNTDTCWLLEKMAMGDYAVVGMYNDQAVMADFIFKVRPV